MQVVLNKKSVTKEIPLYSVALYLNMFFFSRKKYALMNVKITCDIYFYYHNTQGTEWNIFFFKTINYM